MIIKKLNEHYVPKTLRRIVEDEYDEKKGDLVKMIKYFDEHSKKYSENAFRQYKHFLPLLHPKEVEKIEENEIIERREKKLKDIHSSLGKILKKEIEKAAAPAAAPAEAEGGRRKRTKRKQTKRKQRRKQSRRRRH